MDEVEDDGFEYLRREIEVLSLCDHPNIYGLYTSFTNNSFLWVIMPLLGIGSLNNII